MPTASDELRELVAWIIHKSEETVPDCIDVEKFLVDERGYTLRSDWQWKLPKPDHCITDMEELCLRYLVEEWDYGWIESAAQP